jgi:eukaryotic-like serine/threonine-protein kinase
VIHRDLKSTNAVVTPEGRVKVLDFGLAARMRDAELQQANTSQAPLSESPMIVGTLPYLAPELLRGDPADARTDTWALGVLLYEMASGSHPFHGRTAFELSSAILREAPKPLPTSVPSGLGAVIFRCLEKLPDERCQRAGEVHSALEALRAAPPALLPPTPVRRLRWTNWFLFLMPLLFVILYLGLNWRELKDRLTHRQTQSVATPAAVPSATLRKSVAVLGFKNASNRDETAWLSTALSEMLATELAAGEKLRIIPAENVARMERDLPLTETNTLATDTLKRIHNYLGSDLILVGGYTSLGKASGGQLRLDVRLQDAATGETVASVAEAGSEIDLFDVVSRVGSDLRNRLGVGAVAPVDVAGIQASYPTTPEAARLYALGLAKLRLMDPLPALDPLQKAVAADPKFPLAHSALARTWSGLGYDPKAEDEAKLAFQLSGDLSREDRLLVEGQYRTMTHDWKIATEIYRTLVRYFPDNAEYGLRLAGAQSFSGNPTDGMETIAVLKRFPPPQGDDPRIYLEEATAKSRLGDTKGMLEASVTAANKAAEQGSKFVEARAWLLEGNAQHHLGETDKALAAWEQSRRLWASANYPGEVAKTMNNIGMIREQMGDVTEAKKLYAGALSIWSTTGNKLGQMVALANLALIDHDQGDLAASRQMTEDSLAIAREVDAIPDIAETLVDLASLQIDLGDAAGARTSLLESVKFARQFGDLQNLAASLAAMARAFYVVGDMPGAKRSNQEALDLTRQIDDKAQTAIAKANWGEILVAEGDLTQGRKNLQQALEIRNGIDEKSNAAATRLQLAALSIEEGNAADAERVAREVREEFRKEGHRDDEIAADVVLIRTLLAQNKVKDAEQELGNARLLLVKSQSAPNRLAMRMVEAEFQAAAGKYEEALQNLSAANREAARYGFIPDQLKARLAHAEIELNSGKAVTGRAELASIRTDAAARGFGLIAQKANALMTNQRR